MQMGMNKDAVQNERQPRNTATLRPETLSSLDSERILREAVGVFGLEKLSGCFENGTSFNAFPFRVPMDSLRLGTSASSVHPLAKNFHFSPFSHVADLNQKGSAAAFLKK